MNKIDKDIPQSVLDEAKKQFDILTKGTAEVIPANELMQKLIYSIYNKKPLIVKLGVDPTAPDIHLGHTVVMFKLKQFQDFGHKAIFLIGDYTTRIGDPSGRDDTRPPLTGEEIDKNAETYKKQAFKILDANKTGLVYNSEWLSKLTFADTIKLLAKTTVSQILQRESFNDRYTKNIPISMHEMVYPLMQGYDSVAMVADVELGGSDQTFNCLMGRQLQKSYGQEQQVVISMPLLEGLDGVIKMSKSKNNYIGITDEPRDMFGKVMSNNDEIMWKYYLFFSDKLPAEIEEMKAKVESEELHPMEVKKDIAEHVVAQFHSEELAKQARENFNQRFSKNAIPEDLDEIELELVEPTKLALAIKQIGFAPSSSEANRLIKAGAVKINGEKIEDIAYTVDQDIEPFVLQAGKRRIAKIIVK
ncbi:MAG: tyrosine--tRNA ligase [Proteobacteria bacterium]|nr:tyrosine--tRNA ligase [Pseudomonadota bacterium]